MPYLSRYRLTITTPEGKKLVKTSWATTATRARTFILLAWRLDKDSRVESELLANKVWLDFNKQRTT